MKTFATALLFAALSMLAPGAAQAQRYTAQDLGVLWWGGQTVGYGLNNSGQVVGASLTLSGWRGFITGVNGVGMTELGTLGGNTSFAMAINDSGQVAGYATTAAMRNRAFLTGPGGIGMTDLGTLGGAESFARGVNAQGQVVGNAGTRAFVTGPNGVGMTDLSPVSTAIGQAFAVNNSGQVAGTVAVVSGGVQQAFISNPNGTGLMTLATPAVGYGYALALNASGQAAVTIQPLTGGAQAFITTTPGGPLAPLGTLGGSVTAALGINDLGAVVGYSFLANNAARAFVTGPQGAGMVDLNTLVSLESVLLSEARAINERGQILANASNGRAYLLTPVPEPHQALLWLAGLSALAAWARRRAGRQHRA